MTARHRSVCVRVVSTPQDGGRWQVQLPVRIRRSATVRRTFKALVVATTACHSCDIAIVWHSCDKLSWQQPLWYESVACGTPVGMLHASHMEPRQPRYPPGPPVSAPLFPCTASGAFWQAWHRHTARAVCKCTHDVPSCGLLHPKRSQHGMPSSARPQRPLTGSASPPLTAVHTRGRFSSSKGSREPRKPVGAKGQALCVRVAG